MAKKQSSSTGLLNPTINWTKVNLNGIEYKLCFDFNALAKAEEETGIDMLKAVRFDHMTALQYRALLYCALLKNHPTLSIEDAGNLCTTAFENGTLKTITDAILSAYGMSMPEPKEEQEKKDSPESNLQTSNSGSVS
jgi:hypothetical protein